MIVNGYAMKWHVGVTTNNTIVIALPNKSPEFDVTEAAFLARTILAACGCDEPRKPMDGAAAALVGAA